VAVIIHFLIANPLSALRLPWQVYLYGALMAVLCTVLPVFMVSEANRRIGPAQVGILVPGLTYTPFAQYRTDLQAIVDAVKSTGAAAVIVSPRLDLRNFPTLRTSQEIASQRAAFAAYNVRVSADCDDSPNYIFVRGVVPRAILTGAGLAPYGLQYTLSCNDVPGTQDYVLTPTDIAFINDLDAQMSDEVERHAAENGWATFALGVLYDRSKDDVPFDLISYLTSDEPYGHWISLDGVHASAAGQKKLAQAARVAIQKTYGAGRAIASR